MSGGLPPLGLFGCGFPPPPTFLVSQWVKDVPVMCDLVGSSLAGIGSGECVGMESKSHSCQNKPASISLSKIFYLETSTHK